SRVTADPFKPLLRVLPASRDGGGLVQLSAFSRFTVAKRRTTTGLKCLKNRHKQKMGMARLNAHLNRMALLTLNKLCELAGQDRRALRRYLKPFRTRSARTGRTFTNPRRPWRRFTVANVNRAARKARWRKLRSGTNWLPHDYEESRPIRSLKS